MSERHKSRFAAHEPRFCDEIPVLLQGRVMETGKANDVILSRVMETGKANDVIVNPKYPYT